MTAKSVDVLNNSTHVLLLLGLEGMEQGKTNLKEINGLEELGGRDTKSSAGSLRGSAPKDG